MGRPDWWAWDLVFTAHAARRMEERGLSEVELRTALERVKALEGGTTPGRWVATGRHRDQVWTIVLEPEPLDRVVFVVTAYVKEQDR